MPSHTPTIEMFYGGQWNDITDDVYVRNPITLTHGRHDESQQPAPSAATLTLRNTSGIYNPKNPASPLYGQIGRNTPLRLYLERTEKTLAAEDFEDDQLAITLTPDGDKPWTRTNTQAHTGTYSLQSGPIDHTQKSDTVLTVPGGAKTLTFWYKVSSEEKKPSEVEYFAEGFENVPFFGSLSQAVVHGGNLGWSFTSDASHTGSWSARAGSITHNETSEVVVVLPPESTTLTFWYKVSSEEGFDKFRFLVDTTEKFTASGEVNWTQHIADVTGADTVTFRYTKDGSVSEGADTAYIDDITIDGVKPTSDTLVVLADDTEHLSVDGDVGWTSHTLDVSTAKTVTFRYQKDHILSSGTDAAWIDDIAIVGVPIHFAGEIASWTPRRTLDNADAWTSIEVNGISRRLGQGDEVQHSAITRHAIASNAVAHWPLTDPKGSLVATSAVNGLPLTFTPYPSAFLTVYQGFPVFHGGTMGPYSHLPDVIATGEVPNEFAGGVLGGNITSKKPTSRFAFDICYRATPGTTEDGKPMTTTFWIYTSSDTRWQWILQGDILGVDVYVHTKDESGTWIQQGYWRETPPSLSGVFDGNMRHLRLEVEQLSPTIARWYFHVNGTLTRSFNVIAGREVGSPLRVEMSWFSDPTQNKTNPVHLGYATVFAGSDIPDAARTFASVAGHAAEQAGHRIRRLCSEQEIPFTALGDLSRTELLGGQYADGLTTIFTEAAHTDIGLLADTPSGLGITYRTRESLYNQTPTLTLSYEEGQLAPPVEPHIDDQGVANDVTVTRRDGGSYHAIREDGPLSVASPPTGAGRYTSTTTVNVGTDILLADQAGWRLHIGTTDDIRYPQITLDLDAAPELANDIKALRVGDLITIDNLPATIGHDHAQLIVQGWTETIGSHRRALTLNCTPASTWNVGVYTDDEPAPDESGRYSPENSTTASAFQTGVETELAAIDNTGDNDLWSTGGSVPFDIDVAGVRLRVTNISGSSSPQTLTVEKEPLNGVRKNIPSGTPIHLWALARYAL